MSGLFMVGVDPALDEDIENRINAEAGLTAGVSRTYVSGRVHELAAPYATKGYVDTQDGQFSSPAYSAAQDTLLIPNGARATANGVASLEGGIIPVGQVPIMGVGICKGPIPTSHLLGGSTFDIPFKIADWQLGVIAYTCQPWVFMGVSIQSIDGRPVIEVRAGTPTQTTYASQTLVAYGYGRTFYNDYQTVEVMPCDPDLNEGQDGVQDSWPPTTNMVLTAWMYDSGGGQVTTSAGFIYLASAFLLRTAL